MSAKHYFLTLIVLLLLVCPAPRPANAADVQQYVVVYVELIPGSESSGERVLDQLASRAHAFGALRFDVDQEVQRSNFFVLIETWKNQANYDAFLAAPTTKGLFQQLAQFLIAPLDERDGTLIQAGKSAATPTHAGEIEIVTHIDVIPNFLGQAQPLIQQFVADSAKDPGVIEFLLISWDGITNHFQIAERFQNTNTFNQHVSAQHSVQFRNALQPFIGAPYDERLYATHP
jgi:quinol monooxygenase YgiN